MSKNSVLIKTDRSCPKKEAFFSAVEVLEKGGVVCAPTDTCYGLAVDAVNLGAVTKLLKIKQIKDKSRPFILIPPTKRWISDNLEFGSLAKKLATKFWPGAMTLILKKKSGKETVAVRIPDCNISRGLARTLKKSITTTSANTHGESPFYSIKNISKLKVDLVLDGGALPKNPPSTIVDLSSDEAKILREGELAKPILAYIKKEKQ